VLPNESRLSCGAGLEHSQGEFYHTARKTFSGSLGTGAASFKRMLGSLRSIRDRNNELDGQRNGGQNSAHDSEQRVTLAIG